MTDTDTEILATIHASAPRRWLGVISLMLLGAFLIYAALAVPPALGWQIFLLVCGGASIWAGMRLHTATQLVIELTETELRDSTGEVIARVEDITHIDRGFFAFKPSNGFLVRRGTKGSRAWRPGMWWRVGKQIGIGGVTPGSQAKAMSEILATMIAMRDAK